jgi:RHS repeat-associated protein
MFSASRYIYDALGRRIKKAVRDGQGKDHVTYFGWDGDRHVHTEYLKDGGTRDIVHTVYEPGTFTPLVRFSATVKSDQQAKPHVLVEAVRAAMPKNQKNDAKLALMQEMSMRMPEQHRKVMERNIEKVMGGNVTPLTRSIWSGMGINPDAMIADMRQGLEETKKAEQTDITIHYFHCDHLGTPIALTNQLGQIDWAGKYDPWGNIEKEFNPLEMEQNIRLPEQYHDQETGLYYNRHRYYDFSTGAYINQDPIGVLGGFNFYAYVKNQPNRRIDPRGFQAFEQLPEDTAVENFNDRFDLLDKYASVLDEKNNSNISKFDAFMDQLFDPSSQQSPDVMCPDLTGIDITKNTEFTCTNQIDYKKLMDALVSINTPRKLCLPLPRQ